MMTKPNAISLMVLAISGLAMAASASADTKPTVTLKPQPTVTVVPHPTLGPAKLLQTRMRWQDFIAGTDGAKRLASLQAAIKKMKSLDSAAPNSVDFRRSWAYWANIHGYYGSQSPDGTVAQQIAYLNSIGYGSYVSYYNGISDQTPPDNVAKTVWATCQHSSQSQQALNFFGWHRMYLYYFERVLRWAANDNTLRLPYWDYTNTAQLALPAQFRDTTSVLYDDKRDPSINNGSSKLSGNSTDVDDLLPIANYFDYEDQIEGGIHGYVHCTTGPDCPVAHMGDVPVAGNDPVFYHHHANIDRLWACWQKLHGTPAGSWQNQTFSFPDETGALQTKPVKDFLDSTKLGYVYDHVTGCQRPSFVLPQPTPLATAPKIPGPIPEEIERMPMVGATKAIAVDRPSVSVDMDIAQPRMRAAVADLRKPGNVQLVLRDVAADSHPGTMFDVFIAKKGDPSTRQHVGTISWFGAFRHHGRAAAERRTLHFDVTDELRALGAEAVGAAGVTVIVEASSGRVPAEQPAGAAAPAAPQATPLFRREANLRIGSIELRSVAAPGT